MKQCAVYMREDDNCLAILTDIPSKKDYDRFRLAFFDKQGRILLPCAQKKSSVTFIGQGDYVEVWQEDHASTT